jgi:hypothetical protein
MIFERQGYQRFEDMKAVGMQNDFPYYRLDQIRSRGLSLEDDAIAQYNSCKLFLRELIDNMPAKWSIWFPDEFIDRKMARSKVKEPEIEFIEERYFDILKTLADKVRRSRWEHENHT